MRVADLESSMTMRELLDWQRFEAMHEPLPDRLADIHVAMLAAVFVNLARSPDAQPVRPAEFLVIRDPDPPSDGGPSEIDRQMANWRGG